METGPIDALTEILASTGLAHLLLIWGTIILAAVMRAFTGFGFGLTAVPVFSLFMPPTQAVVLSTSLSFAVSLIGLRTYWGHYPARYMVPLLVMTFVGTVAGVLLLQAISVRQFQLLVGFAVIGTCLLLSVNPPGRLRPGHLLGGTAGLAAGIMGGAFAMPGPPVIVYAMATEPEAFRSRSLLMTFFLFSAPFALCSYATAGFVTALTPWLFLLGFPAMLLGDVIGYALFRRFGSLLYRRVALAVLLALGLTMTIRSMG